MPEVQSNKAHEIEGCSYADDNLISAALNCQTASQEGCFHSVAL